MQKKYKKKMVLIPSAYNSKVMGDIDRFIDYYKNDFDLYVIYDSEERNVDGVKYINKKNKYSKYLIYTADYIIDAGSINGNSKICNSQKRISVWHGIPYKNMFIDLSDNNVIDALEYDYGVDLMVSPSKFYSNNFLKNSMLYDGEILETSVSRTDSLFISEEKQKEIKSNLSIPNGKKILLFCPTFRVAGKYELPFNPDKLIEALNNNGEEWIIISKLHYLNTLSTKYDNVIDCTNYSCINELLSISDLLITDYSSLMFDYSLLNKPTIFYQYDKKEYTSDRGFMFKLEDYVDKKYIITNEKDLLKNISSLKKEYNLKKIKETFYPHQVKNSTEKLVSQLNLNSDNRNTKDIIFLVNDLNQIGGVHNFILNLAKEFKSKYNSRIFVFGNREYAVSNNQVYNFDTDNTIDIKLSYEKNSDIISNILKNTDGYIIACQFGAYKKFQSNLKGKNAILMFHGDTKDIVSKTLYPWHLDALNKKNLYNYKRLLLLTKGNADLLSKSLSKDIKDKVSYIENSYDFSNSKKLYKKNGEFALVSRLDEDKNIFDVLKIFSNEKLNKKFILHVYGDGKLKDKFIKEIEDLGLQKRIILHNYVDDKEEIYKDKQGIISTSLSEGFPLIIMESVKYGIPIYLYNSFTATKEFENSSVVKLIEKSNIEEFVKCLNSDNKFNEKDFDIIKDKFSNENILKKWLKLFSEIDKLDYVKCNIKISIKNKLKSIKAKIKKVLYKYYERYFKKVLIKKKKLIFDIIDNLNYLKYKIKGILHHKKHPKVSIIVPFYNNNKTLNNLLKSIKKSGYSNYEVILVNDGSNEDPKEIYLKYDKVKYFYKEHEGPGKARNYGLNKATGKYVFYIDSDDTLSHGALNYLVDYAEKHKLSVVCGLCRIIKYESKEIKYYCKNIYKKTYINDFSNRISLLNDTISTCKLYNLEELRKSNIVFESGLYEDKYYVSKIFEYFDRIGVINHTVYNWYKYGLNSSITTTYDYNNASERLKRMDEIINISSEKSKPFHIANAINHDLMVFVNNYIQFDEKEKIFNLYREYFIKYEKYIYINTVNKIANKVLINYILNNNYKKFDIISNCISKRYYNLFINGGK